MRGLLLSASRAGQISELWTGPGEAMCHRGARYVAPHNRLDWEILSVRRRGPGVCQLRDDYGSAPRHTGLHDDMPNETARGIHWTPERVER